MKYLILSILLTGCSDAYIKETKPDGTVIETYNSDGARYKRDQEVSKQHLKTYEMVLSESKTKIKCSGNCKGLEIEIAGNIDFDDIKLPEFKEPTNGWNTAIAGLSIAGEMVKTIFNPSLLVPLGMTWGFTEMGDTMASNIGTEYHDSYNTSDSYNKDGFSRYEGIGNTSIDMNESLNKPYDSYNPDNSDNSKLYQPDNRQVLPTETQVEE